MAFQLADLPAEVLDLILYGKLQSYLVIDLWKCGSTRLCAKLASGVTYLDLKDLSSGSTSRYPKLVSNLRNLRHFSIDRSKAPLLSHPHDLTLELIKLSSLESLFVRVCLEETKRLFRNYADRDASSTTLRLCEHGHTERIDMQRYFPRLRELSLPAAFGGDLAGFPPTLTYLKLSHFLNGSAISSLPNSLTHFDAEAADGVHFPADMRWPSNLTSLSLIDVRSLSTALYRVKTANIVGIRDFPDYLPPELQTLSLDRLNEDSIRRLPCSLTELGWHAPLLPPESIAVLPTTITLLRGQMDFELDQPLGITPSLPEGPPIAWPPLLRTLETSSNLSTLALKSLPSGMTRLEMAVDGREVLDAAILPRSLTQLTITRNDAKDWKLLPGLPASLTSLKIAPRSDSSFIRLDLHQLPSRLLDLQILCRRVEMSLVPVVLPLMLQTLVLPSWDWNRPLPPTLHSLRVDAFLGFKEPRISLQDPFASLPPTLSSLHINALGCKEIRSKIAFSSLRNLRNLTCPAVIHSSVLRGLSPHLKNLNCRMNGLDEQDMPFLPQRATRCGIELPSPMPSLALEYWPLDCEYPAYGVNGVQRFKVRQEEARQRGLQCPDPRVLERTSAAHSVNPADG